MKLSAFFILFILNCSVFAQENLDILTISGRYGFPKPYTSTFPGNAQETGALINLNMPIPFSNNTVWYNNFTYTHASVNSEFEGIPDSIANPINLNAFILRTGLVQRIDETRAIQILLVPRFMTDFENANGNGTRWQMGAIGMFEKRYNDKLRLRYGAMYNNEFGGPLLVPLLDILWQISEKSSIKGFFPIYLKYNYKVNDNLTAGISHFGLITSYRLGNPNYVGDYMERTSIDITLFANQRIAGNLYIEGRFGYALGRQYAQYAADQKVNFRISIIKFGDNRVQKNVSFDPGPIANLRLIYSIPLPQ